MKATGIVRRIDDLGRVVIPKEIRRTMRIREGDPLEIYTTRDGEVIFKKYSLIGGLEEFAAQFCDTLSRSTDFSAAVTDRDAVIAIAGAGKKELLGKPVSPALEQVMDQRGLYCGEGVAVSDENEQFRAAVAAPILCGGDVLGAVLFLSPDGKPAGETECKLAQTVASFLANTWSPDRKPRGFRRGALHNGFRKLFDRQEKEKRPSGASLLTYQRSSRLTTIRTSSTLTSRLPLTSQRRNFSMSSAEYLAL